MWNRIRQLFSRSKTAPVEIDPGSQSVQREMIEEMVDTPEPLVGVLGSSGTPATFSPRAGYVEPVTSNVQDQQIAIRSSSRGPSVFSAKPKAEAKPKAPRKSRAKKHESSEA